MKRLKQIIREIYALLPAGPSVVLDDLLAEYLFYSPKMPLRLAQEELLQKATPGTLSIYDEFFSGKNLRVNTFKWGNGSHRIFLTHGWGSKAADFSEVISALLELEDIQIVSFDAPGNGSSEGQLSNLLLYILSFREAVLKYGEPHVVIGHSLGAMANAAALSELQIHPKLLISITPLVRLRENFEASMDKLPIGKQDQERVLTNFADRFRKEASSFTLNRYFEGIEPCAHWLFYDEDDLVSPFPYLQAFLDDHTWIKTRNYKGAGHERILKSADMITDLTACVSTALLADEIKRPAPGL